MNFTIFKTVVCLFLWSFITSPILVRANECAAQSKCIFVIGNSITQHGPSPEISWTGNWGMAATSSDNDYVSQVLKLLKKNSGHDLWTADRQSSNVLETTPEKFTLSYSSVKLSQKADIVIVALGDNFTPNSNNLATFSSAYLKTLFSLRPIKGVLVCVGTWWSSAVKDKIIQDSCLSAGGTYVDITGLSKSPDNVAGNQQSISNKGVAAHPGDLGMAAIAERIFKSIQRQLIDSKLIQ